MKSCTSASSWFASSTATKIELKTAKKLNRNEIKDLRYIRFQANGGGKHPVSTNLMPYRRRLHSPSRGRLCVCEGRMFCSGRAIRSLSATVTDVIGAQDPN